MSSEEKTIFIWIASLTTGTLKDYAIIGFAGGLEFE